jgi:hypothetical protein
MKNISYDFIEGQLVRLFHGVPESAWAIHALPDNILRDVLVWNDENGDFYDLPRQTMLEIFIHDFIVNRQK